MNRGNMLRTDNEVVKIKQLGRVQRSFDEVEVAELRRVQRSFNKRPRRDYEQSQPVYSRRLGDFKHAALLPQFRLMVSTVPKS